MKIHWFSPLAPARSGIAEYTAHVLPALAARAEVVLWTEQERWDRPAIDCEVRRYRAEEPPWAELNRGGMAVYHLGNNYQYHGGIWRLSRQCPGVIVLHDPCLPDLFLGLYRHRLNDAAGFFALMEHHYGEAGKRMATASWEARAPSEYMARHYPLTPAAVEGALGVVVHTPAAKEQLLPLQRWPLLEHPLAFRSMRQGPAVAGRDLRPGEPYRLVVFGHISVNRRLDSVLEAIAKFPRQESVSLHVYGGLWDEDYVRRRVSTWGLTRRVTLHGFVSDRELDAALASAHLGVNLRYPTMGEGSTSQLRLWDHALPTLVTNVGWYATLPSDVVSFVRPDREAEDIVGHLSAFLDDPTAFARMGEAGRRYLAGRHTADRYADAVLGLCEEAVRFRPRAAGYYLAGRAGAEMGAWNGGTAAAGRSVAQQIAQLVA